MDPLTFTGGLLGFAFIVLFLDALLSKGGVFDERRQMKEKALRRRQENRARQAELERLDEDSRML